MHRGFDLKLSWDDFEEGLSSEQLKEGIKQGTLLQSSQKKIIREKFDSFIRKDGLIDASAMIENWFPEIKADIFISHSHKDKNLVLFLSGLFNEMGLTTFIDSTVWGNSAELLKDIDNRLCYQDATKTYNYDKRNQTTAHVHMMLTSALGMMMDKCECLFFLNTPNSVTVDESVDKTKSPWIFYEISLSKNIRKHYPRGQIVYLSEGGQIRKGLENQFVYALDKGHLPVVDFEKFAEWYDNSGQTHEHALDTLYSLYPIDND